MAKPLKRVSIPTKLVLKTMLSLPTKEWYGQEIIARTALKHGSLYPILRRLEEAGWTTSRWEKDSTSSRGRQKRKYYIFTESGRAQATKLLSDESYLDFLDHESSFTTTVTLFPKSDMKVDWEYRMSTSEESFVIPVMIDPPNRSNDGSFPLEIISVKVNAIDRLDESSFRADIAKIQSDFHMERWGVLTIPTKASRSKIEVSLLLKECVADIGQADYYIHKDLYQVDHSHLTIKTTSGHVVKLQEDKPIEVEVGISRILDKDETARSVPRVRETADGAIIFDTQKLHIGSDYRINFKIVRNETDIKCLDLKLKQDYQ